VRGGGVVKLQVDKLVVTTVEVELPDTCPGCGVDFHGDKGAEFPLLEHQLIGAEQVARICRDEAEHGDAFENGTEPLLVTGYQCSKCGYVLIEEYFEPSSSAAPNGAGKAG
jgi:rubredoxin